MAREVPGSKKQRDQLRRDMRADGHTYEEIATEFARRWFRPRQAWRHAYGWTQDEVAARYNQLLNNDQAPMTGRRISDYENWPYSGKKATHKTLSVLAKIYSTSASKLIDHYDRKKMNADERIALEPPSPGPKNINTLSSDPHNHGWSLPAPPSSLAETSTRALHSAWGVAGLVPFRSLSSVCDLVVSAATQSKYHAENAQGQLMSEATLDEITAEVSRLVKERSYTDPLVVFSDAIQARDGIYRFLERRQYPRQTTHLYYLVSIVCALLANLRSRNGTTNPLKLASLQLRGLQLPSNG